MNEILQLKGSFEYEKNRSMGAANLPRINL